uniref:Phosphoribosylformylglycinamidine cyclo-ligase n=1 Tax=Ciona savignyi TaxID=51511 RepID=H2ZF65_CIOSA
KMANILIIGSGAREHCLAWKLNQSDSVKLIYVTPGNAGTFHGKFCVKVPDVQDFKALAEWCVSRAINLVVVGPEIPLAEGINEALAHSGILCFGPSSKAAEIESNKSFTKDFMIRHNIPTARYKVFTDSQSACQHINAAPYRALVVKASGLAAGKGVVVAKDKEEACNTARKMLNDGQFGAASSTIVIEELLEGEEYSILCFTDGCHVKVMPPVQDNKRVGEGNTGPNTGGMGAYCPCPQISKETMRLIEQNVLKRTVQGLHEEGRTFKGAILPLLESDLYSVMMNCINGRLSDAEVNWKENHSSVALVVCSEGYPGEYKKGKLITGMDNITEGSVRVFEAGTSFDRESRRKVTSGGRVLTISATTESLPLSNQLVLQAADGIQFEGAFYRRDIAKDGIIFLKRNRGLSYAKCGVSIENGDSFVASISSDVKSTARPGSTPNLGGFGGCFDLEKAGYNNPILVAGTDGVGTKLLIAQAMNKYDKIGLDLVAMCANDVLTHNAESLFFLDYYACGSLQLDVAREVLKGISLGCAMAGCALIGQLVWFQCFFLSEWENVVHHDITLAINCVSSGGETAEMPGLFPRGVFDIGGFVVGAYEKGRDIPLPKTDCIIAGDVIVGVMSSGLHSNGFSLVRKVIELSGMDLWDPSPFEDGKSLGESLLKPTAIYCKALLPVFRSLNQIRGVAHITGGGIVGNLPRVLPSNMSAILDARKWPVPPVFRWLAGTGDIPTDEMLKTFNCGLGLCIVTSQSGANDVIIKCNNALSSLSLKAFQVGEIVEKHNPHQAVVVTHLNKELSKSYRMTNRISPVLNHNGYSPAKILNPKTPIAILISGTGSNMQALIKHSTTHPESSYQVKLVISNKADALGLIKAQEAGIMTKVIMRLVKEISQRMVMKAIFNIVIDHRKFKVRESFDREIDTLLLENNIEIICLAGFMRLLSGWMVQKWHGKILNIHPSLLPSFKGVNAPKQALNAGVKVTGCTVHFVVEEMDDGAIIEQRSVRIETTDDVSTLQYRIKLAEHQIYPTALDQVAKGLASLDDKENKVVWN